MTDHHRPVYAYGKTQIKSDQESTDEQKAALREAERRIKEAARSGATEPELIDLGLVQLPGSIGQLAQVQRLAVSGNQLVSLPEWLGRAGC